MFTVKVLGRFEIRLDGQPIEIPGHAARSLLAYLLLNAGVAHRRARLAGLFWPDSDESNARNNLRHALWRIRKAIGHDYLLTDSASVAFDDSADYSLDADVLQQPLSEDAPIDELMETVAVYEGELFPGLYDDWAVLERERLRTVLDAQYARLLDQLLQTGRWEDVLQWGERWIALGAAPEAAYRALMTAHAALGNLVNVGTVYRRCVDALRSDLNVVPSPETQALFGQLSRGEIPAHVAISADWQGSATRSDGPTAQRTVPASLPAFLDDEFAPPALEPELFAGRERELARLDGFLDKARAGHGQVVFVTGSAGRGKTSLLREFARRAQESDGELLVASGHCNAYAGFGDPYLPFRDVMNMLTGDVEAQWLSGAITRQHARRLWDAAPDTIRAIIDAGPDLIDTFVPGAALLGRATIAGPGASGWSSRLQRLAAQSQSRSANLEQSYLFEQYVGVLERVAHRRPLLITLDDLQWADTASISLLFHLGRRIGGRPILIVGAYRPEETALGWDGSRHPLQKVLSEFSRIFGDNSVDLIQAEEDEGKRFVDVLLDMQPNRLGEGFRSSLFRQTAGHPLFTVELLRAMQARGDLVQDSELRWVEGSALDWDILPARVEAVVQERIGRLDARLHGILSAASVEGESFTAEVVARVQGLSQLDTVRYLSEELGTRHRLVRESEEVRVGDRLLSGYRFSHILFQRYLQDRMHSGERRQLHAEITHALEELYEGHTDEIAARLVRHAAEGGMRDKAIEYARAAARRAEAVYAYDEAIQHLQATLDLLEDEGQDETRLALLENLADLHKLLGQQSQAFALYQAALDLCSTLDSTEEPCTVRLHRKAFESGDFVKWNNRREYERLAPSLDVSGAVLEANLSLPPSGPMQLERARVLTALGKYGASDVRTPEDLDVADSHAQAAVELAEQLDEPVALADALYAMNMVYFARGMLHQQLEVSRRRLALTHDSRFADVDKRIWVLEDVGLGLILVGEFAQAIRHLQEAADLAAHVGAIFRLVEAMSYQARCLFRLDRWDDVLELHGRTRELARRHTTEQMGPVCVILAFSAAVLALRGDSGQARALREESYGNMIYGSGDSPENWGRTEHY